MNSNAILRWAIVLCCGGFGLYCLGAGVWGSLHTVSRDWVLAVFGLVMTLLFSGVPLAVACLAYFREDRQLAKLVLGIAAFLLFGALSQLVRTLGGDHLLPDPSHEPGWRTVLGPLLGLSPLIVVILFCRWATRLVDWRWPKLPLTPAQLARRAEWQRRTWPVRRGLLWTAMAGAELMVWVAALLFVGALWWVWDDYFNPARVNVAGTDAVALGVAVMVASLLVFLLGLIARGSWRTRLQVQSAAHD